MQHGPSMIAMLMVSGSLLGIMWLGARLLAKWHPLYARQGIRRSYWLVTTLAVAILIFSRWLQPAGGFPGEWFRYFVYAAYIWMIGLVFLLVILLAGHILRLSARRLRPAATAGEPLTDCPKATASQTRLTRREFLQGALAAVPAVPLAVSAFGVIDGDSRIVVNNYNLALPQWPSVLDGFTIAQISDTHIGPFFGMNKLQTVLALIREQQPQLLVITGDLVDDLALLVPTVRQLTAFQAELPYGLYYCWGNHEYFRDINQIRTALHNSPVVVLENSHQAVTSDFYLAGVDYPWGKNKSEQAAKRQAYFSQAVAGIPDGACTVLLSHHPDFFDNAFAARVPLSLAGHTHGGQLVVGGRSLLPVQYKYMNGLYRENGCYGYVSAGTGHWLPLRLGCPAEVSVFTLRRGIL